MKFLFTTIFILISISSFAIESDDLLIKRWNRCPKDHKTTTREQQIGGECNRGLGGPLYDGLGGPLHHGLGGNLSWELGGRCYDGLGGNCYSGLGGNCSDDNYEKKCPEICKTVCELDKKNKDKKKDTNRN